MTWRKSWAGLEKRPLVTRTMTSPLWTGRPVPLRTVRCSVDRYGQAGAAVFALDDPASAVGVGGLDVGAVVSGAADLGGVRATVAVHQVAYGVLEVAVVQLVEAGHRVTRGADDRLVLPDLLDPGVLPQDSARGGHHKGESHDPEVPGQPVQPADNPQDDGGEHQGFPSAQLLALARTGRPPAAHRLLRSHGIG